ncbi:MAG: hypothetical protein LBJ20_07700 [Candidatus Methanoplasma sp.]|jgi:hypothetical protein|nr:hypothetical protein [Candidatus Methanoplasma sp.]
MKKPKLSQIDRIEISIAIPTFAILALGYLAGGEKGMFFAAAAAIVVIMSVPLCFLVWHVTPAKSGRVIRMPPDGTQSVKIETERSKYMVGRRSMKIFLDGNALAEVSRGNIITADVPEGMHELSVCFGRTDEVCQRIDMHDGLKLFLWTEPFVKTPGLLSVHVVRDMCTDGETANMRKAYRASLLIFHTFLFLVEGFGFLTVFVILWKIFGIV